jgi:hypothetical protein
MLLEQEQVKNESMRPDSQSHRQQANHTFVGRHNRIVNWVVNVISRPFANALHRLDPAAS